MSKELKPTFADAAKDVCILRFAGDRLGWSLVQIMDDLKDWFYQLATHPSESGYGRIVRQYTLSTGSQPWSLQLQREVQTL